MAGFSHAAELTATGRCDDGPVIGSDDSDRHRLFNERARVVKDLDHKKVCAGQSQRQGLRVGVVAIEGVGPLTTVASEAQAAVGAGWVGDEPGCSGSLINVCTCQETGDLLLDATGLNGGNDGQGLGVVITQCDQGVVG